jgi:hypothetical protein
MPPMSFECVAGLGNHRRDLQTYYPAHVDLNRIAQQ